VSRDDPTVLRRPLRPIPWWWAVVAAVAVGVAIWMSTWWLLAQTHGLHGAEEAQARMDAIKAGLSVGAGIGGAVALLVALRRQWLSERDQAHREDVAQQTQAHSDRLAAAAELDAAERRITELYIAAVNQLGSDKAAVRLGGLYALERLAQSNQGHRQTIVDVICAYLRMPAPQAEPAVGTRWAEEREASPQEAHRREELQVRKTAQRILAAHLRDETYADQRANGPPPDTFWAEINTIDLAGAHLVDFGLVDCRVDVLNFNGATFTGESVFRGLSCDLAFFQGATFCGHTDFRGATFVNSAWFSYASFATDVWFHADEFFPATHFGRHAAFKHVTFTWGARFDQAIFSGSIDFSGSTYGNGVEAVRFDGVHVEDPNATSPDSKAASNWPPGWVVELGPDPDGAGTLIWRLMQKPP
jgi:uncharacterized protein YjbI with pentapeptide repeats